MTGRNRRQKSDMTKYHFRNVWPEKKESKYSNTKRGIVNWVTKKILHTTIPEVYHTQLLAPHQTKFLSAFQFLSLTIIS